MFYNYLFMTLFSRKIIARISLFVSLLVTCLNSCTQGKSNPIPYSTIQNLFILGKVWGFLKYYHPAVANGAYNWDDELFKIIPKIKNCSNTKERNKLLLEWIKTLGPVDIKKTKKMDSAGVKLYPDLNWLNDTLELGLELSKTLIDVRNAKRSDHNYYVNITMIGNPEFTNEKTYDSIANPDISFRLLALYRYWNIINYFYPNKHLIGRNWDSVLAEFIPKFENDSNNLSYRLTALELIANIHDTHANIYGDSTIEKYWGKNAAPLKVKFIENKAVVYGLMREKEGCAGLDKGDVIITVNNISVEDIVKERLHLTPASNYPTQLRIVAGNLFRTNDTILKLTYERGGKTYTATIKCLPYNPMWTMNNFQRKDTCFKYLSPDIAYLYPGSIKSEYLPTIAKNMMKTKGLIIDLRCYPSTFIVYSFSKYLLPFSSNFVKFSNGNITTPGLFTYTKPASVGEDNNTDYYRGKIVILVNELTQSQAEFTAMAFRVAPNVTVLGSTTAGADGNVSPILLPGKIRTLISGIGVYYPDGKETQRVGIIPDIVVQPTINGILENRDEVLDKALELIRQY